MVLSVLNRKCGLNCACNASSRASARWASAEAPGARAPGCVADGRWRARRPRASSKSGQHARPLHQPHQKEIKGTAFVRGKDGLFGTAMLGRWRRREKVLAPAHQRGGQHLHEQHHDQAAAEVRWQRPAPGFRAERQAPRQPDHQRAEHHPRSPVEQGQRSGGCPRHHTKREKSARQRPRSRRARSRSAAPARVTGENPPGPAGGGPESIGEAGSSVIRKSAQSAKMVAEVEANQHPGARFKVTHRAGRIADPYGHPRTRRGFAPGRPGEVLVKFTFRLIGDGHFSRSDVLDLDNRRTVQISRSSPLKLIVALVLSSYLVRTPSVTQNLIEALALLTEGLHHPEGRGRAAPPSWLRLPADRRSRRHRPG